MLVKFIFSSITIFLLYSAYAYLRDTKTCKCIKGQHYPTRLKNLELIMLSLNILTLTMAFIGSEMNLMSIIVKSGISIYAIGIIFALIVISFYSYFVYNVYKFRQTIETHCDCADKWPYYYIILQAIIIVLSFIIAVFASGYMLTSKNNIGSAVKRLSQKPSSFRKSYK